MAASVLTAVGLSFAGPLFRHGIGEAIAFGLAVGLAGVLGDLAESLIKLAMARPGRGPEHPRVRRSAGR